MMTDDVRLQLGNAGVVEGKRAFAEAKQRGERIATDSGLWDRIKPKWPVF